MRFSENVVFEGFFIWFDFEKDLEYYVAPHYSISDLCEKYSLDKNKIIKTRNKSKKYAMKSSGLWMMPHHKKIGTFLTRFLNTDFSNFENAYKDFYYDYGFEFLCGYTNLDKLHSEKIENKQERILIEDLKKLHDCAVKDIILLQKEFKESINFLYNLNGKKDDRYSSQVKFMTQILRQENNLYKYNEGLEIINHFHNLKAHEYKNMSFNEVAQLITDNKIYINFSDIYTSKYLGSICFCVLNQMLQNNTQLRTCQYCGRYFVPNKLNEIYCDRVYEDGRTCRELGALKTYKENLETNLGLLEYRRIYNKKSNRISRNKEDKTLKKEFNIWKKNAQTQIKRLKKNEITEKELYEWMIENE